MSAAAAAAVAVVVSICMHKQGRDDVVSSLTPGHMVSPNYMFLKLLFIFF